MSNLNYKIKISFGNDNGDHRIETAQIDQRERKKGSKEVN